MENALSAPLNSPVDFTWPDEASLAAFRAGFKGCPAAPPWTAICPIAGLPAHRRAR